MLLELESPRVQPLGQVAQLAHGSNSNNLAGAPRRPGAAHAIGPPSAAQPALATPMPRNCNSRGARICQCFLVGVWAGCGARHTWNLRVGRVVMSEVLGMPRMATLLGYILWVQLSGPERRHEQPLPPLRQTPTHRTRLPVWGSRSTTPLTIWRRTEPSDQVYRLIGLVA